MPWQGLKDNMIDRFDVRAHLDIIPEVRRDDSEEKLDHDQLRELRHTNYERYRILIQNDFLKCKKSSFLIKGLQYSVSLASVCFGLLDSFYKAEDKKISSNFIRPIIVFKYLLYANDTTTYYSKTYTRLSTMLFPAIICFAVQIYCFNKIY